MPNSRYQTATLSYDDIRQKLSRALDDTPGLAWVQEVWDGYFIYQAWNDDNETQLYKQTYSIGADDKVTLTGDPVPVEEAFVKKGTVDVVASRVVTGDKATQLIADLKASNTLIAAIDGTGNGHLTVLDLTTVGKASQHEGPTQFLLEKSGLSAAAPTLITKPLHVTQRYDGHVDANKSPVPIGTFIGYAPIENADNTITLRTVASLWSKDFPDIVEEIKANKSVLGASYEIEYDPRSATRNGSVIHIANYAFTGGAILLKQAAAHPETAILFADAYQVYDTDEPTWPRLKSALAGKTELTQAETLSTQERGNLKDSDFALIQSVEDKRSGGTRKVRRFPIHDEAHRKNAWARVNQSQTDLTDAERNQVRDRIMSKAHGAGDEWAKGYKKSGGKWVKSSQGGQRMAKYAGISDDLEPLVETLIANRTQVLEAQLTQVKEAKAKGDGDMADMKKQCADKDAELVKATNQIGALTAQKTQLETEAATLKADLKGFQDKELQVQHAAKLDEQWAALKKDYGLVDDLRAGKSLLLEKLVAGKEPLTVQEWKDLSSGGTPIQNPLSHVLHAGAGTGNGFGTPDPKRIATNFPAAAAMANKRPMFK